MPAQVREFSSASNMSQATSTGYSAYTHLGRRRAIKHGGQLDDAAGG
jgi:hypothetical protein